jgi:hypothetical protein
VSNGDKFTMTPNPVQSGQSATITFHDISMPNCSTEVVINNGHAPGTPGYQEVKIDVTLDGDGWGTFDWTPPEGWSGGFLTHPNSTDHGFTVSQG